MSNIWDDQEPFRDSPIEFKSGGWQESETYTPAPENTLNRTQNNFKASKDVEEILDQDSMEEFVEQASQEDEEDYTEVLSDARLRLEQGRLYEMIIQHSLFENMEADPRAIKSVQNQIRKFARERMEIMLGIRQEETIQTGSFVSSPFNDLEVIVLKKLASTFSKGATESEEVSVSEEVVTAVVNPPKKNTLNSIGSSKPKQNQPKPIQKKNEPIKRVAKQTLPSKPQNESKPLDKPIHEMTRAELEERDRQIAERQKKQVVIPQNRVPQPDYATQEMLAYQQVNKAVGNPSRGNLSALIMANLKNSGKV
jgi:hypothetical protein